MFCYKKYCNFPTYDNAIVEVTDKGQDSRLAVSHFGGEIKNKEFFDKINNKMA